MNEDPQVDPGEFSEVARSVRDEVHRDARGRASTSERRTTQKPGVSPLALLASVFGALFVGAAGMSLYDATTEEASQSAASPVDVRADLQAAMTPHTQRLEQMTQSLATAQQAATEDSKAHGLLLDRLAETVTSLEKSAEARNAAFHERVDLLADELATKIARKVGAEDEPTVAARPPIPESERSAVQPANAETDVTEAEANATKADASEPQSTEADDGLVAVEERPVPAATDQPESGKLIIDNPSGFELKLLINGELHDIKARGVTSFDVTVATIKTQIASIPDLVQTWDKWETVDGVKQLTINVESGNDYYKLR